MEQNGMERNRMEWSRETIPLFWYSTMKQNKFTFPLFGKLTEVITFYSNFILILK